MKLKSFVPLIAGVLLIGGPVLAQESKEKTTVEKKTSDQGTETTKQTTSKTDAKTTKTKKHTVVGSVKEFEAGKSIEVKVSAKKTRKFALDNKDVTTTVDPAVAKGVKVKVTESTDDSGKKVLSVEPYKKS